LQNKFYFDVKTTYDDYLKVIPKEKILMGVPYYGRDWAVQSGSRIQSKTLPDSDPDSYRAVISYARAREMKEFKKSQCKFDSVAQQPWCWYTDEKTKVDHQVWFEDTKSIGLKYDFAKNQDFGGVAIWVLGYDKDYPDLWNLIKNKFSDK
jgi:spore germination protein